MTYDKSPELQRLVNSLFGERQLGSPVVAPKPGEPVTVVSRLDVVIRAESLDLGSDAQEIVNLLPPVRYRRQQLCDQINSSLKGHGWTRRYLTVE